MDLPEEQIDGIIDIALAEDISHGDVTSETLLPPGLQGKASFLVKATGVWAGGEVARKVLLKVDPSLEVELLAADGKKVHSGDTAATVAGRVSSILKAERTALNFVQRLSGIATQTAQYITETAGTGVIITDTRKTTPGLRMLEKYAVRMGGGRNHRLHLGDGVLIKDNHLAILRALGMSLQDIVARARQNAPAELPVEVEVTTIQEAQIAAAAGADIIMLDNMSHNEMRRAIGMAGGKASFEASGGITLDNVRAAAMTGVNTISIGALTHSPKALDISLELEPQTLEML